MFSMEAHFCHMNQKSNCNILSLIIQTFSQNSDFSYNSDKKSVYKSEFTSHSFTLSYEYLTILIFEKIVWIVRFKLRIVREKNVWTVK